jgi:tRNA pseudouridine38-40 synthase
MSRWALGVEYVGTHFCGWQHQTGLRSIEGALTEALSQVADHDVSVTCGGRTDAGVHALGQVVHFESTASRSGRAWMLGANAHLERFISVAWAQPVPDHFHARYSALRRHYRYQILNRPVRSALHAERSAWVREPLDASIMHEAAQALVGEHDFSAFRAAECQSKSPIRRLESLSVHREGEQVVIDVCANAFLHHMVRNIAGLLISIGRGERSGEEVARILATRDRRLSAPTAPPEGLYLRAIEYPEAFGLPIRL